MRGLFPTGSMWEKKRAKLDEAKTKPLPQAVIDGLRRGATRNLFIGNIDPSLTVEKLHADLSNFGPIEKVDILASKKIAFVHFTSILNAMRAADELKQEGNPLHDGYATCRINFGKDRCATDAPTRRPSYRPKADAAVPDAGYQAPQDMGGYGGYQNQGWAAQA